VDAHILKHSKKNIGLKYKVCVCFIALSTFYIGEYGKKLIFTPQTANIK